MATAAGDRDRWAAYIQAGRTALGIDKTELGRRVGVDRGTVRRWENAQTIPDDGPLLHRIAEVFGVDVDEVLAAAGLRPDPAAPRRPSLAVDPEMDAILLSGLPPAKQEALMMWLQERRQEDREARLTAVRMAIRVAGGKVADQSRH